MNAQLWVTSGRVGQQELVIPTEYGIVVDSDDYLQLTREHTDR